MDYEMISWSHRLMSCGVLFVVFLALLGAGAGVAGVVRDGGKPLGAGLIAGSFAIALMIRLLFLGMDFAEVSGTPAATVALGLILCGLLGTVLMGAGVALLKPAPGKGEAS